MMCSKDVVEINGSTEEPERKGQRLKQLEKEIEESQKNQTDKEKRLGRQRERLAALVGSRTAERKYHLDRKKVFDSSTQFHPFNKAGESAELANVQYLPPLFSEELKKSTLAIGFALLPKSESALIASVQGICRRLGAYSATKAIESIGLKDISFFPHSEAKTEFKFEKIVFKSIPLGKKCLEYNVQPLVFTVPAAKESIGKERCLKAQCYDTLARWSKKRLSCTALNTAEVEYISDRKTNQSSFPLLAYDFLKNAPPIVDIPCMVSTQDVKVDKSIGNIGAIVFGDECQLNPLPVVEKADNARLLSEKKVNPLDFNSAIFFTTEVNEYLESVKEKTVETDKHDKFTVTPLVPICIPDTDFDGIRKSLEKLFL